MPLYTTGLCPLLRSSPHWRRERIFVPKPRLIGHFSVIREEYVNSLKNMRYICLPSTLNGQINWDLNTGFENYSSDQKPNPRGRIDRILKFIQTYPHKVTGEDKTLSPDFVCSRGFLSKLMETPYTRADPGRDCGWKVLASKFRGTIYFLWLNEWSEGGDGSAEGKRGAYYGYKFRQMITTHELNKPSTIDQPVDREKFSGVFDTKLGAHRLLYAGEIFGVDSDVALKSHSDFLKPSVKIIQMHTKINTMKYTSFLRNKLMHWWCKTVLIGAETVYAGNRTREGILESIEPIAVKDMPRMASNFWSDSVCIKFCTSFLDMVKDKMAGIDDPDAVYQFMYDPNISDQVQYEIFTSKSDHSFLPNWYIDYLDGLGAEGPTGQEEIQQVHQLRNLEASSLISYEKKEYRKTIFQMNRALKIAPSCQRYKLLKAECLALLGCVKEAKDIAESIIRTDSTAADAVFVRGLCLYYSDNLEECLSHFEQTLSLDPYHQKAKMWHVKSQNLKSCKDTGNSLFKAGKFREALKAYTAALEIDENNNEVNSHILYNRALMSYKLNQKGDSIRDCNAALNLKNNYVKAILLRGKCHTELEDFEEAIKDYEQALKFEDTHEIRGLLRDVKLALEGSKRRDYYEILGVSRNATNHQITKAYRKLALLCHPDRHVTATSDEIKRQEKKFKVVGQAYSVLSDPQKKAVYDYGRKF
ncbi:protein cutoff-like [Sergentomyia squamirostris]